MPAMMLFFMAFLFCASCQKSSGPDNLKEYELSGGTEETDTGTGKTDDPEAGETKDPAAAEKDKAAEETVQENPPSEESPADTVYVYVCGAVNAPGVYELPEGARVFEAVERAGGISAEGAPELVNQAKMVEDGERIYIPTREEAQRLDAGEGEAWDLLSGAEGGNGQESKKININTAGMDELMTLAGIGEAKAQSIISYREENGGFSSIEEIMEIEGIKEGVFDKIKDDITI